jgi:hypothetical protein
MAFNVAGAMQYARPVDAMYEGRALRQAEQVNAQNLRLGAQEEEMNALKLDAAKNPKPSPEELRASESHQMKRATEFMTSARELHAQTYALYDSLVKGGQSKEDAQTAAQAVWDRNRKMVADSFGKDFAVQLDDDGVWTPEESLAGMQKADELLAQLKGGGDTPTETQSFRDLAKAADLDEDETAQAARIKLGLEPRAGVRVIDIPQPDGTTQKVSYDISTGQATVLGRGRSAEDEAREKLIAEAEAQDFIGAPKRLVAANDAINQIENNLGPVFDSVEEQADAWSVGLMSLTSIVPNTPAANLKANVETLLANSAFDRLQEMRANSPTGGALGSITERELDLLAATRAALARSQSPAQFRENLTRLRNHYERAAEIARQATQTDSLKTQIIQLRRRPPSSERDERIARAQERIASIEDKWWDSLDSNATGTGDESVETRVQRLRDEVDALEKQGAD